MEYTNTSVNFEEDVMNWLNNQQIDAIKHGLHFNRSGLINRLIKREMKLVAKMAGRK